MTTAGAIATRTQIVGGNASVTSASILAVPIRTLQALVAAPALLFLTMLACMLLRPPDAHLWRFDRVAFALLSLAVVGRAALSRELLKLIPSITIPLLALLVIAGSETLMQPFDVQTWSLLAAKFCVPFVAVHAASSIFADRRSVRLLHIFLILVLSYLLLQAIAWLLGLNSLIFPRYILDENLGIHPDRARGPFLQAIPNGVTLILLGLVTIDLYRHGRLPTVLACPLLIALPVAILATMTRAVWISFALSILWLLVKERKIILAFCLATAGILLAAIFLFDSAHSFRPMVEDRVEEYGPVEIRLAVYRVSYELFCQKPILGWGHNQIAAAIAEELPEYRIDGFAVHNTFLEIALEHGIVGLALYGWVIVGMFRLGFRRPGGPTQIPLQAVWPTFLFVYFWNACFVVMNYQFVNALVFTCAGVLAGQSRRSSGSITH